MDQPTFADLEYESKKRKTRREIFLERMDALIPWEQMEERIRPLYPKAGRGRRPYELSAMVRIHCVQLFYNLSDPGKEDMLYEVESVRRFVGLKLSGPLPDETTILNFRHLLEEHELGQSLFEEINRHLESQGLRLREGTIVDASIIEAPSSTKNRAGERDPEMHQTKKGNEWRFGMKVHVGADAETGVVHSMTTTPANVHDVTDEIGWEKRTPKSDKIERRRCQYERCPSRKIHEGIPPGSSEAGNGREAIIAGGSPPVVPGAIDVRVLGEGTKGRQTGRCRQDVQALD